MMSVSRSAVYFAYLGDEGTDDTIVRQRLTFMDRQLSWLHDLIEASTNPIELVVPYTAPRRWDAEVARLVGRYGFQIDPAAVLSDRRNSFEYPGFRALKALAEKSEPDHLIYYCHSKGIVQLAESKMGIFRLHTQIGLSAELATLTANPGLSRAGLFPSKFGWCWYNFFWIKAGYMAARTVEESTDRHHFEALIGDRSDKEAYRHVLPLIDCLPFADSGIELKPWYRPEETVSPALLATYDRYVAMQRPPTLAPCGV